MPDITLIDVELSGLREVEIFGPGMAVVVDESYYASDSVATSLVLATVVDVLTSNVPQDDCSFEDLFQLSYVIDRDAGFVDSLSLPTPGSFVAVWVCPWPLKAPSKCSTTLGHTVVVTIS